MRLSLLLTLLLLTPVATAQAPTEGFTVAPRIVSVGVATDNGDNADGGGGLGLRIGYGFTKTVTGYVSVEGASIEPGDDGVFRNDEAYALGSFDLGAQFNLLPSSGINPFLRVALNGTTARYNVDGLSTANDPEVRGGGLTLGAGAEIRLSQVLGLELALDVTGGTIQELEVGNITIAGNGDDEYATARLGLGLVWRP
ncbi:MAG: outer membrane beta-barrel protein [Bacteroidota bacterium]